MYKKLVTVGLEIEVSNISFTRKIMEDIARIDFKLTRDASVEGSIQCMPNALVFTDSTKFDMLEKISVGGEIVSPPIDTSKENWQYNLFKLMEILQEEKFIEPSNRCSFHIHVNIDDFDLKDLLSMVKWASLLESTMFRIGSFCKEHRGIDNNYNYCRPITQKGPQVIKTLDGFAQVMILDDLLQAKNIDDFLVRYGDAYHNLDMKYHPVRYSWFNLFKLFQREKTIEYRVFNQTLNPLEIEAMVTLCLCITNTMLTSPPGDISSFSSGNINSIFNPLPESRNILEMILGMYPGSSIVKDRIMCIFDNSNYPPIKDSYVFSHMLTKKDFTLYKRTDYVPVLINKDEVEACIYKDLHNYNYIDGFKKHIVRIRKK